MNLSRSQVPLFFRVDYVTIQECDRFAMSSRKEFIDIGFKKSSIAPFFASEAPFYTFCKSYRTCTQVCNFFISIYIRRKKDQNKRH